MIELTVNGKIRTLEQPLSVSEYLARLGINAQIVAVEVNGEILRRERFTETRLNRGDVVEIVRMVGGGSLALAVDP
jgi:thiamine biosynthesis protein ThiS